MPQTSLFPLSDSKAATLQVLSHETLYSLEMVRCVMAPTDQQIPSSETSPDRHNLPGTSTSGKILFIQWAFANVIATDISLLFGCL